jgi:2-oxoglutarate dehydrogenase E1 component
LVRKLGEALTRVPDKFAIHKTLQRILDAKKAMFDSGSGFDWATAEAMAFGSLLLEGHKVRLSGQDSGRGTFSQRHAVWHDQSNGEKYIPLCTIEGGRFEVRDSPLSEFGVLGFEYGYSIADPKTLVLWEAQFGDFANGAQTIIDQFIAAGEAKWLRASGLVMLLPHGFEGQGPEHSSARLERYLQLCAEDNLQVANCTTPANYFHILRRQLLRDFRKPLILMTPKSLLRHKLAVSDIADFTGESHFRRIVSDLNGPGEGETRRLVLCSGKLAYELMEARDQAKDEGVEILRIEQLYPFPSEPLVKRLKAMPKLEQLIWAQEEPKNNGAWLFAEDLLVCCLNEAGFKGMRPQYAGRDSAASPATGLAKRHAAEQAALIAGALGHSSPAGAPGGGSVKDHHGD